MGSASITRATARRAAISWGIAALFVGLLLLIHVAAQAWLLTFGGLLFGVALRGLARVLARRTRSSLGMSLVFVVVVLVAVSVGVAIWVAPSIAMQVLVLGDKLDEAYTGLQRTLESFPIGRRLLRESGSLAGQLGGLASQAAGYLASAVGVVAAVLYVVFVALYVAAAPQRYHQGVLALVFPRHRPKAEAVLGELACTLQRWMAGRIVSMTAVGVFTGCGLWALAIPLPVTLGLIAGVLGFVPNIGPIVSVVPAALIAFTVGPMHMVYVLALYLGVNLLDGYALTPWLQQRAVTLPPAMLLAGQVVIGALWGVLGVMLATPLLACAVVIVHRLYVEQVVEQGSR